MFELGALETLTMGAGALSAGPAGPSNATGGSQGGGFDSSGWNVTFGNNSGIEAARNDVSKYLPYLVAGVAGLILWRMTKKK